MEQYERSLSYGEDLVDVGEVHVLSVGLFAALVELHLVLEAVLAHVGTGDGCSDHSGVREEDAVEGQTGSFNGVLVHFDF